MFQRHQFARLLFVLGLAGCASTPAAPPAQTLRGLVLYADPVVATSGDCKKPWAEFPTIYEKTLIQELRARGVTIAYEAQAPAHGTLKLAVEAKDGFSIECEVTAAADLALPSGSPAGRFAYSAITNLSYGKFTATYAAQEWARSVAKEIGDSERLQALARAPVAATRQATTVRAAVERAEQPAAPLVAAPIVAAAQTSAYALVVGIESYRDGLPAATGAKADAERMAELFRTTFGLRRENVRVSVGERAARSDIERQLRWLKQTVPAGSRIYFYFSGHGSPEASGTPYLLPYDADPTYLEETALPVGQVIARLQDTRAKDVIVILDSCFSGAGGRSVLPAGARPLIALKAVEPAAKVSVLSASAANEISGPALDANGGVFTRYLIEGLATGTADTDGDRQISPVELVNWVKPRVSRDAERANRKQTPELRAAANASDALLWGLP